MGGISLFLTDPDTGWPTTNDMVDKVDALNTTTHLTGWLNRLPHSMHHDLLMEYNINDKWTPAPTLAQTNLCAWDWDMPNQYPALPLPQHQPHGTLDALPYPQVDPWVPDPTKDGDVEPNPGPTPETAGGEGIMRTLTESFERQACNYIEQVPHPPPPPPD